jgi:hypothetical protein
MEYRLKVILAILILVRASLALFEVIGLVDKFFSDIWTYKKSPSIPIVMEKWALILIVFVLIMSSNFPLACSGIQGQGIEALCTIQLERNS